MRYTKLVEKRNEECTIKKEKQYVIDCTVGNKELTMIGKINEHESGVLYKNYYALGESVDKLGEYEDLEEKGLLLKLPCKIGEKIFVIDLHATNYVAETEVKQIRIRKDGIFVMGGKCMYDDWANARYEFNINDFGEKFFPTLELALTEAKKGNYER